MRKVFLNCMLLLCALIAGSGTMWGAADYTYTLANGDFTTSTHSKTSGTITWTHAHGAGTESYGWDNDYGFKFGSSNKSYPTSFTLTSSSFSSKIKKVVVTASVNSGKTCKLDVKVGSTTYGSQATINTKNHDTWEFTIADASTVNGAVQLSFSSNTGPLYLEEIEVYYYEEIVATALSVKTAPTKVNYKKGETLDLTGLVLDATIGGNHTDVTTGYTASPANGAALNSVGAQDVTFTYGGQNTTQIIHVGDLESIALTTTGVKTTYDEGQTFDPENLVVTATYSDGETIATTWTESVDLGDCLFDPDDELETTDDNVEVSYTWGSTTKTANIGITVNAAVPYTVTFNKGTGTCATSSLTEASAKAGVTLPTATIGVTGWSFVGWATASVTNTEDEPTIYTAGSTYNPTDNCTLYAVYKFSETSATTYKRATSVSDITGADKIVIAYNDGKVLNTSINLSTTLTETSGKVTPAANAIFTLSGNNTDGYTLTNGTNTIGATGTGSSLTIALSSTNNLWTFSASTYGSNHFNVNNKRASGKSLEVYNSAWKAYALTASGQAWAMRIYVPAEVTVYNSNPAAIVNPIVAWTTDGDKTLYLQNTNTYDNAANVTGIAKTPVYTSSDATVATVSDAGVVTALKKGSTTITAKVAKEVGVNTEASVSYEVTVKDASNIAGLKEVATSSSATPFTADLTNAVVTYVNGTYAYIEDASGAIYASCGSSLTAGKKINGAVSGSVKVSYQIDEITAIDLSDATIEDGVIPSAAVISAAMLAANKADYEGKLVSIEDATVTASLANGSASGGKISDDSKVTEINLYAPKSNIEALKDAEGTFNGYISLYNGGLRFNIYEQSQITLTKNAPTAQTLTFASDAVELDEETSAYSAFTGQAVNGAVGDVTYSIDSDDDGVVTSIDDETGAVVLSGNNGTATIKASAEAKEVTVAGVTTPYTATTKTYTVTVYPRYTVTFSVNGVESASRQATHSSSIDVPNPSDIGDYKFQGWSTTTITATDIKPTMEELGATVTPESNSTYYAVFAVEKTPASIGTYTLQYGVDDFTPNGYGNAVNVTANDGSSWVVKAYDNSGMQINTNKDASIKLPVCPGNITTIVVTGSNNNYFSFGEEDGGSEVATPTSNTIDLTSESYTTGYINPRTGVNVITKIVVNFCTPATYKGYRSIVPLTIKSTPEGYATFYAPYQVTLPTADVSSTAITVTASIGTYDEDEHKLILHNFDGGVIPAATPVILKSTGGSAKYTVTPSDVTDSEIEDGTDLSDNDLHGTAKATEVNSTESIMYYVLARQDDNTGFYKIMSPTTIPAYRAYLTLNGSGEAFAGGIRIVEAENNATNIENIEATDEAVKYIQDGKLFIKKNGIVYDAMGHAIR